MPLASFGHQGKRSAAPRRGAGRAWRCAVAITMLILLASFPQARVGAPAHGSHPAGALSLSPQGAASRPASMGLSAASGPVAAQGAPSPTYDEQLGATFTQDFNAITYNVTAVAQADADGYGPGYLLNGLTTQGYWYQVGVSYHWPNSDGSYNPGFGFSYQVYGTDGKPVYPSAGAGLGNFSGVVNSGDSVLLSLNFTGPSVMMLARDWNTGAAAATSYSSEGALSFVGDAFSPVNVHGFFTGLMTEWYHAAAYYGNQELVTYTNKAVGLNSAWMWIDEFKSGTTPSSLFNNQTQSPVTFANDQQIYPFSAGGATVFISAHQFITGLSAGSSSRLTLAPAAAEASSPSFSATFTFAGQQRAAVVATGATLLAADPGTFIRVSINSSASSSLERWVFNGTAGNEVTFAAGTNAAYVYYHLVREAVSYRIASGGQSLPTSSKPELAYEEPPPVASSTSAPVTATQVLGTTPVIIYAVVGTVASVGPISGASGERWAANPLDSSKTVSAPDSIANPLLLYQQYEVAAGYSVVGGGTPPQDPGFTSTAFGSLDSIQLSGAGTLTLGWFDAGSSYSYTSALNGTTAERWATNMADSPGGVALVISSPNQHLTAAYVHQYYANLTLNDASGGRITPAPGWFDAGSRLNVTAAANKGWRFEMWSGSGAPSYSGTDSSLDIALTGPLSETATFFVQLAIAADAGTDVAFTYGSHSGTVQAGTTETLYVPPSSNVTLSATPSLFIYSFASWQGAGLAKPAEPSAALVVDSPIALTGTSSLDFPVILAIAAAAALIVLATSLMLRNRRRRESGLSVPPS